jgi:hypothetical protein
MTREEAIETLKANYPDACYEQLREAVDAAIEALKAQDVPDTNVGDNDLISRSDAIDAVDKLSDEPIGYLEAAIDALVDLPSAQPEITEEQAIEHLQSTGWMQNHDREMYDMGLKKQLADDSGSYDSLFPSAQPERKWIPCSNPPKHHRDVLVRGIEAIGNVNVYKVMQWDVDTWRPTDYAPSIIWKEWSEI